MAAEAEAVPLLLDQMAVQLLAETEATEPHLVSLVHLLPTLAAVVAVVVQQPLIPAVVEQVDRVAVVLARLNRLHLHQIMVLPVPQTLAEAGAVHQMAAAQAAQAALAS